MFNVQKIKEKLQNRDKGFLLTFSVLIAALLLSIGIAIFEITFRELVLSSGGRESQLAFYAADSGAECALYWDIKHPSYAGSIFGYEAQDTSLVLHWPFDDLSQAVALDSAGNGNEGVPFLMSSSPLDIALVCETAGCTGPDDAYVINILGNQIGHNITYFDVDNGPFSTSGYDAVIISESVSQETNTAWLKSESIGVLTMDGQNWKEFDLGTGGDSTSAPDDDVTIQNGSHYITRLFNTNEIVTVLDSVSGMGHMSGWSNGVDDLAIYSNTPNRAWLLAVPAGGQLVDGTLAAERRVFMGAGLGENLNETGDILFERAINWVAHNEPTPTVNGQFGSALDFNNSEDVVKGPTDTGVTTSEGAVSLWFKTTKDNNAAQMLWYACDGSGCPGNGFGAQSEMHIHLDSNESVALFFNSSVVEDRVSFSTPTQGYNDGAWHHVVVTWSKNDDEVALYVDGSFVDSAPHTGDIFSFEQTLHIGRPDGGTGRYYQGAIDDVRLFSQPLSSNEVSALFQGNSVTGFIPPIDENSEISCNGEDITRQTTGWDSDFGWEVSTQGSIDAQTIFDMLFSNGACATITVIKDDGQTRIESRGFNTCDLNDPRRVERGLRVRYTL